MPNYSENKRRTKIRDLNDAFHKSLSGGRVMLAAGVAALPDKLRAIAMRNVQTFDTFSTDNDPYGEHDFGSFDIAEKKFFWKIDAYDAELVFGSDDPSDPEKTTRVLTIMHAEEY